MPSLAGFYKSKCGRTLIVDNDGYLSILPADTAPEAHHRLRANGHFWLCKDDGLVGKFGTPEEVKLRHKDREMRVWVEPRGYRNGQTEYGLVPTQKDGQYSNLFLAVSTHTGEFLVLDDWEEEARFRCIESKP